MNRAALKPLALGLSVTLALVACRPEGAGGEPAEPAAEVSAARSVDAVKVRTVAAQRGALQTERTAGGTVEAEGDSAIAAEASGRVVNVLRRAGDTVQAGETIVQLDASAARDALRDARLQLESAQIGYDNARRQQPSDLASAKARLGAATTTLANAQRTLQANEELFAAGGLARNDLEQSRAALANARADLESAQGQLERAERAPSGDLALQRVQVEQARHRLEQLTRDLAKTDIKAPFAGQLAEVTPGVGEFVAQGSPVFRLLDTSSVRVKFQVPPADAQRLRVGREVTLVVNGESYPGRVQRNAGAPGEGRLVTLEARFAQDSRVPVGASALVRYRVNLAEGTLVPTGALQVEGGQSSVFVANEGTARRQDVTVLAESGGRLALQGLEPGSEVVYPVPGGLQPDARIQVLDAAATEGSSP